MRSVSVYKRRDGWYFHANSRSSGAWVASPPFLKLPLDASYESIGQGVITALNGSLGNVPFPTDWEPIFQPALKLAGVESWSAFAQHAQCVSVKVTDTTISILPWRKDRGSFFPRQELEFELNADASPEEIGEAVQHGIELCK